MADLTDEENSILEAFEKGALRREADADRIRTSHQRYAAAMLEPATKEPKRGDLARLEHLMAQDRGKSLK